MEPKPDHDEWHVQIGASGYTALLLQTIEDYRSKLPAFEVIRVEGRQFLNQPAMRFELKEYASPALLAKFLIAADAPLNLTSIPDQPGVYEVSFLSF